jgi:hypothetical protein
VSVKKKKRPGERRERKRKRKGGWVGNRAERRSDAKEEARNTNDDGAKIVT